MRVSVVSIARNDAKARMPDEVVYDVETKIDAHTRCFEVLVASGLIGPHKVPHATFRDPADLRVFRHDQRPITDILRGVLDIYNREQAVLPA